MADIGSRCERRRGALRPPRLRRGRGLPGAWSRPDDVVLTNTDGRPDESGLRSFSSAAG